MVLELLESERANPSLVGALVHYLLVKRRVGAVAFFHFHVWMPTSWLYYLWLGGWSGVRSVVLTRSCFCLTTTSVWSEEMAVAVDYRVFEAR